MINIEMMHEPYYALRLVNIVLALVCVVWLIFKANKFWDKYNHATKAYVISLGTFALTVLYGTAEVLAQGGVPGGYRLILTTLALLCMIYALWHTKGQLVHWKHHKDGE